MANGRNGSKKNRKVDRDGIGFIALPWAVIDSQSFKDLSLIAKALLLEVARQYVLNNNGRLLCSMRYLKSRGLNSCDVVTRAKRELIDAGFIFETVMGHRPNKASWYAITWYPLDKIPGYDAGAEKCFVRSAYSKKEPLKITPLNPPDGTRSKAIAPFSGTSKGSSIPPDGSIKDLNSNSSIPYDGNHLDNHLSSGYSQ